MVYQFQRECKRMIKINIFEPPNLFQVGDVSQVENFRNLAKIRKSDTTQGSDREFSSFKSRNLFNFSEIQKIETCQFLYYSSISLKVRRFTQCYLNLYYSQFLFHQVLISF